MKQAPLLFSGLLFIFAGFQIVSIVAGVLIWFDSLQDGLSGLSKSIPTGTPFTLAQVVAIFGALGLAGGFSNYGNRSLQTHLRLVGVIYLLSALGFVMLGLLLPTITLELKETTRYIMTSLILAYLVLGGVCFAGGTLYWLLLLATGKLLGNSENDREPK